MTESNMQLADKAMLDFMATHPELAVCEDCEPGERSNTFNYHFATGHWATVVVRKGKGVVTLHQPE